MTVIATLTIASAAISLLALFILHFVSPELQPSWRMVSEYALGKHKWLLSIFFFCWGISSILASLLLWKTLNSGWGNVGCILFFVSGAGAIMGGLFDVKHKLHGLSFTLGVPTLIAGSLLIAYQLSGLEAWMNYSTLLIASAHSVWISCVLMATSMGIMFSGFKKAGVAFGPDAAPPDKVPPGVIALAGYANRLLVLCYVVWNILIAYLFLTNH
ncbi:MAG: DUF998 domain-containing protein [Bacteroidia bacterium]|nr:DUF998 domain-containing protein [Bacteroidia bacterium]